jgi:hypothetical protein
MEKTFQEFNEYTRGIAEGKLKALSTQNYTRYLRVHSIFHTAKDSVKDGLFSQDEFEQIVNIFLK